MSSHTAPRFKVGDVVYTEALVSLPGYGFRLGDVRIDEAIKHHNYTEDQVTVEPAVFGVIIQEPPVGTWVNDSSTIGWERKWEGVDNPNEEAAIDIPGSGSVWFLPDDERKFFVKWINKQTRPLTQNHTEFQPMTSENGVPMYNVSLHFEQSLHKAPNFVEILRKRVKRSKQRNAELVLQERLGVDTVTSNGIASMISNYC